MENHSPPTKHLEFDRLVFFSDAVVAIAITLLALDLHLERPGPAHLHWADIGAQWRNFAAFLLSFLNIAGFWRAHYTFFSYLRRADDKLVALNTGWLLFIVLLPFSTTLVSSYITDRPAILLYSLNTLIIALFQYGIWQYATNHSELLKPQTLTYTIRYRMRLYCRMEIVNALVAVAVTFVSPAVAFVLLFTKIPIAVIVGFLQRRQSAQWLRRGADGAAE